ncbi:hypothetical protein ACQ86N_16700 [Puia sp. P3]|uniref:hypothetical protein n=1 Tax=Puia sp. P3 TaxID=3423952 RepID=UPI003D66AFF6
MQEELAKHTKKIYKTLTKPGHTMIEKLKEVAVEIFIIVFAVTLSIWLHSWSDHRQRAKRGGEFLKGLQEDLGKDIAMLERKRIDISQLDSGYQVLLKTANQPSAINPGLLYFNVSVIRPAIGRYEGFKSSGKIGLVENDSLKQLLLVYYEQTIPDLVYGEGFVNSLQVKLLDAQAGKDDKVSLQDYIRSGKIMGLVQISDNNFRNNIRAYDDMLRQAKSDRRHDRNHRRLGIQTATALYPAFSIAAATRIVCPGSATCHRQYLLRVIHVYIPPVKTDDGIQIRSYGHDTLLTPKVRFEFEFDSFHFREL